MTTDALDKHVVAHAVSKPLRVRLLDEIAALGEASPVMLAKRLDAPLSNVSYHVLVLANAGLIRLVRTRQRRGALEHYYRAVYSVSVKVEEAR